MRSDPHDATLSEVALLFLRLGFTAFGGPAAHVAIMEEEVVRRRRWLSPEQFLDLLGAANLIPGPSSTELAIFIGYERAGWPGLLVGGACFILPAATIVALLAWVYVRFGALAQATGILYGIKPVVIAVVVQALWGLVPRAIKKSPGLGVLGLAACAASAAGVHALALLVGAGLVSLAVQRRPRRRADRAEETGGKTGGDGDAAQSVALPLLGALGASGGVAAPAVSLLPLFLTFLKAGALVFGSGYVLLAWLREDLVDRLHWLTESQLLDAVAIGQVTPGPVFTTATFIGYVLAGGPGAALATLGVFLPGFVLVAVTRPVVARLRRSPLAGAFLDGVNVAAVALMAVVTVQLGRSALVDPATVLIALASAGALMLSKVNTTWLVAAGAAVGAIASAVR